MSDDSKLRLGTIKNININALNFDAFIKKYDGFDHSDLIRTLRKSNKTAYEVSPDGLVDGIGIYYVMEQKSGETLIVYGHYENNKKQNEIRFIYSIEE